jgi:hypothetical protein
MSPTEERLEHVRYISNNFANLQGLLLLPSSFGLLIGFIQTFNNYLNSRSDGPPLLLVIISILISILGGMYFLRYQPLLLRRARLYYETTFGESKPMRMRERLERRILFFSLLFIVALFCVQYIFADRLDRSYVEESVLLLLGLYYLIFSGPRFYARILGGVVAGTGVASVLLNFDLNNAAIVTGTAFAVLGLADHVYLEHHMKQKGRQIL